MIYLFCGKQVRAATNTALAALLLATCLMHSGAQTRGAGGTLTGERRPLTTGNDGFSSTPYLIGPGDTIDLSFRYTPEFNEEVVVGPDGHINTRSGGDLQAAGLTVAELQRATAAAAAVKLVKPELVITLKDFDRPHVYVAGEVNTPGRQELRHPTTALQAIMMSGGPKDDAALGRVLLFRRLDAEDSEVHVLQLNRFSRKARGENDMLLQPGDIVLVRHDVPSRIERIVKTANLGFYLNPLQNVAVF